VKKQSAHARSEERGWGETAAGGSDGPKTGSKTPGLKISAEIGAAQQLWEIRWEKCRGKLRY